MESSLRSKLVASKPVQRMVSSPLSVLLYFPSRASSAAKHSLKAVGATTRWLFGSREATNYTYDLTERNLGHLAWFVANLTNTDVATIRGYLAEIVDDAELIAHVAEQTKASPLKWGADYQARFGRRVGWYAFIRALKPARVVETGTDKGIGSLVIAAALLRNGTGRLSTIDINPASGYLISGRYATVTDIVIGDGVTSIGELTEPVDIFIHDSNHSSDYEKREFLAIASHLAPKGIVLSDNAHASDSLQQWAEETGRRYHFFDERPSGHWYPGASIGVAEAPKK